MLKKLHLQNFKCFADQKIDFAPLTLLTGINGAGKSSVIQALLFMQQSFSEPDAVITLPDNTTEQANQALPHFSGMLCNLGIAEEVLYAAAGNNKLHVALEFSEHRFSLSCFISENGYASEPSRITVGKIFHQLAFLHAERIAPSTLFPIPNPLQRFYNFIGNHGQFAASILEQRGYENITYASRGQPNLLAEAASGQPTTLLQQTEFWLSKLGMSVHIHTEQPRGTDMVTLRFSFPDDLSRHGYRPTNVGFGLTYALPVFVATLSAGPNAFIIVENPEAHLHPKGQAIMGHFLARAAACGIQILLETHSDHVLNGIRLAVKKSILPPDDVFINFFAHTPDGVTVLRPRIDQDGHIDQWPEDFFDEWDKQLAGLL